MSLRLGCLTLALLVCLGGTAFAKPGIAILGLEVIDKSGSPTQTDAQVAEELTQQLRSRAKTSGPYLLVANGEKELIDEKLIKSCDDEKPVCMQGIGKDLSADILMYGHIEKQNNAYQVTMFLFDVARKTREKTYPETIPLSESSGPALAGWARKIYGKLTGQTDTCVIVVKTNGVDNGTILVNGAPKGSITNGVGQVNGLTEGRYKLAVEAKDYHRWEKSDITCTAGQTTNVPAELEKRDSTSTAVTDNNTGTGSAGHGPDDTITGTVSHSSSTNAHGPWFYVAWTTGAVAVASLATGVFASSELLSVNGKKDCVQPVDGNNNPTGPATGPEFGCNHGPALHTLQYPTYIGAGVLAGVAIVAIFEEMRDHKETEQAAMGRRKHRDPVTIVPVVSPSGGGVTFSMRW
ncbi:MAG TPA: carboxypeptidase-like regulatory domain-containing protein [Kofleriaceae bacterium]|jgi:hypothetical protein|nr:carboxypeptidase-like regulatory domain-containing protein [Kofleriaceae bacterium]